MTHVEGPRSESWPCLTLDGSQVLRLHFPVRKMKALDEISGSQEGETA